MPRRLHACWRRRRRRRRRIARVAGERDGMGSERERERERGGRDFAQSHFGMQLNAVQ